MTSVFKHLTDMKQRIDMITTTLSRLWIQRIYEGSWLTDECPDCIVHHLSFIFKPPAKVPVRSLILPTLPQPLKLFSVWGFSPNSMLPTVWPLPLVFILPSANFEPQTIWAQIAYADSDLSGMNQISARSMLQLAVFCTSPVLLCSHSEVFKKWQVLSVIIVMIITIIDQICS